MGEKEAPGELVTAFPAVDLELVGPKYSCDLTTVVFE
jgi:hypothetical protein